MKRLSLRELNRALLDRQMLLTRQRLGVVDAVERLGGLQAQWPPSPYLSLWTRLEGFRHEDLSRPIEKRQLVKATLQRTTLHLVSAAEYAAWATITAERRQNSWKPPGDGVEGMIRKLHGIALEFAKGVARTRAEIVAHLEPHLPRDKNLRAYSEWAMLGAGSLLLEPACALWEHRRDARYVAAPPSLCRRPSPAAAHDLAVRRHLAAFGPATVADIAAWSGARTPPIREALGRMDVVTFEDEKGRELFDLPKAPRPDPGTPAPPRFLPRFDNAILGHAAPERARIMPDRFRSAVVFAAEVRATFLVDGFVAGKWSIEATPARAVLQLKPFAPIPREHRDALFEEGKRLLRFAEPGSRAHVVKAKGPGVPRKSETRQRWV